MQLRTASIKGYVVEREMLLENLLWAVNTARERGSTTEVRKCIEAIGKLFGLIIDRVEADVMNRFTMMKDVTVDGSNLMFDVGSGEPVIIKGERQEVLQNMQEMQGPASASSQDAIKSVVKAGDTNALEALQNASKTLPMKPVDLDDVPLEGFIDLEGLGEGEQVVRGGQRAKRTSKLQNTQGESLSDEEALLLGEIA